MGKTKELLMKELSEDKETRQQKFAVFQNRIFKKEGYVEALETLLSETKKRASEQIFNHCTAVYQRYAALWRHLLPPL